MVIRIIAAVDSQWALGNKNHLLFDIPQDMTRFKSLTLGHLVLQGRNTFESIVSKIGKPLPNRINCVLTRNKKYKVPLGVFKSDSVDHIINHYNSGKQDKDLWVIGGAEVYNQFLPHVDECLITYIDAEAPQADTYFNRQALEKDFYVSDSEQNYCEKTGLDFYYVTYKRKLE